MALAISSAVPIRFIGTTCASLCARSGSAPEARLFGVNQTGADRRNANAFAGNLVSEPDSEGIDRAFGRRIIDIGIGRAEFSSDRRQIADDAPFAAIFGSHPLHP